MKIIKRNGTEADFNIDKIERKSSYRKRFKPN